MAQNIMFVTYQNKQKKGSLNLIKSLILKNGTKIHIVWIHLGYILLGFNIFNITKSLIYMRKYKTILF